MNKQEKAVEEVLDDCPEGEEQCPDCLGTGDCIECDGEGCEFCDETGECQYCEGTGCVEIEEDDEDLDEEEDD